MDMDINHRRSNYIGGTTSSSATAGDHGTFKRKLPVPSSTSRDKLVIITLSMYLLVTFLHVKQNTKCDDNRALSSDGQDDGNDHHLRQYKYALSALRCFSTPGCFPSSKCHTGRPRKLQRRMRWEEQSFCVDDLQSMNRSCLVYSFGIHESYEWEEKVAKVFGCEVHAFDPTMDHNTDLAPGVTFHKLGLQADGTNMARTHAAEYDAINPNLLLPLDQIMTKLGHEQRSLDVLMMDCEGCEWGVLHKLACSKQSSVVKQIVVEFHFQSNLGLETKGDVEQAAEAVQCLWDERWHITSIEQSGAGAENWVYAPGVTSILHKEDMLLYASLQRIPEDQSTPAQIINELSVAGHDAIRPYNNIARQYGSDERKWTPELRSKIAPYKAKLDNLYAKYSTLARESVKFDQWERMSER